MFLQFSTKTAEADTSSELAKKSKETFRKEVKRVCLSFGLLKVFPAKTECLTLFSSHIFFVCSSDVPVHSAMSESVS